MEGVEQSTYLRPISWARLTAWQESLGWVQVSMILMLTHPAANSKVIRQEVGILSILQKT